MSNMRKIINLLESVLTEGQVANIDQFVWKDDNFGMLVKVISLKESLENISDNPKIQAWFSSNFYNFLKKNMENGGINAQYNDLFEQYANLTNSHPFSTFEEAIASFYGAFADFGRDGMFAETIPNIDFNNNKEILKKCQNSIERVKTTFGQKLNDTVFGFCLPTDYTGFDNSADVVVGLIDPSMDMMKDEYLSEIIDFFNAYLAANPNADLQRMAVPDAYRQCIAWTNNTTTGNGMSKEQIRAQMKEGKDYKTVYTFPDSYTVIKLITPLALRDETNYMGHCVGKGGYDDKVLNGGTTILSLRDNNQNPLATMEIKGDDVIQVKGIKNRQVDPIVHNHITKFIVSHKLHLVNDHDKIGLERKSRNF